MIEKVISDIVGEEEKMEFFTALSEALNKQVPRAHKMIITESGDRLYGCPACENVVFNGQKHCDECGQKMKWE